MSTHVSNMDVMNRLERDETAMCSSGSDHYVGLNLSWIINNMNIYQWFCCLAHRVF